jgi:hypothetical protein
MEILEPIASRRPFQNNPQRMHILVDDTGMRIVPPPAKVRAFEQLRWREWYQSGLSTAPTSHGYADKLRAAVLCGALPAKLHFPVECAIPMHPRQQFTVAPKTRLVRFNRLMLLGEITRGKGIGKKNCDQKQLPHGHADYLEQYRPPTPSERRHNVR